MKVILSFDYELFFGTNSGSPEKCMIEPANALASIAAEYRVPLCFFVDTGYLVAMKRFGVANRVLRKHEAIIRHNLDDLSSQRHEILLHVHPHWEDTVWTSDRWHFDLSRFCLNNFNSAEVMDIVKRNVDELRQHTKDGRIHAYRAGGWAVQPFPAIGRALKAAGINIDSTVFPGGINTTGVTNFDFSVTPNKPYWFFDKDPATEDLLGSFLEVPTSSMSVSPSYYWRTALARLTARADMKSFGDGMVRSVSTRKSGLDKLTKLFSSTLYCVTLDGMKAGLAVSEYRRALKKGSEMLVLLSHPKMITPFSLQCLRQLLKEISSNGDEVIGYEYFDSTV